MKGLQKVVRWFLDADDNPDSYQNLIQGTPTWWQRAPGCPQEPWRSPAGLFWK